MCQVSMRTAAGPLRNRARQLSLQPTSRVKLWVFHSGSTGTLFLSFCSQLFQWDLVSVNTYSEHLITRHHFHFFTPKKSWSFPGDCSPGPPWYQLGSPTIVDGRPSNLAVAALPGQQPTVDPLEMDGLSSGKWWFNGGLMVV